MKFPKNQEDRERVYIGLRDSCGISRGDRGSRYAARRTWYLRGAEGPNMSRYNKLAGAIRDLTAFLFAAEMTRFGVKVPRKHAGELADQAMIASQVFGEVWHDNDCAAIVTRAIEWACVYDTIPVKILKTAQGPELYLLHPGNFGVLREGVPYIDRQEAFCEWYSMGVSELERSLEYHPDGKDLFRAIASSATTGAPLAPQQALASAQGRLQFASISPNMVGTAGIGFSLGPEPMEDEPQVECCELWVWDDELGAYDEEKKKPKGDYRVVDMHIGTDIVMWDRPCPSDWTGSHPYVLVTPEPDLGYLWGHSKVEPLIPLQAWREELMNQISERIKLQLKPPRSFTGWGGLNEDRVAALNRPNGFLNNPNLTGKVETFAPEMPPDAFAEVKEIDKMFSERLGLKGLLEGQADPSVRNTGQAGIMTSLASAGIRQQSLIIEDQVEEIATKFFRILQVHDDDTYVYREGDEEEKPKTFLLSQLPKETVIKVAAHTSSPLYAERLETKAAALHKEGLLDADDYIHMIDLPLADLLGPKAKRKAKAKAEKVEEAEVFKLETERAKATRPRSR